jgi:hypothetical protein
VIDCTRFDALQRDALDGPLPAPLQVEVDAHLVDCPDCLARMRNLVVQTEVLRRLGEAQREDEVAAPPLPESLVRRVLTALAEEQGGGSKARPRDGTLG